MPRVESMHTTADSVYHNPFEVVAKTIATKHYYDIVSELERYGLNKDPVVMKLRTQAINVFNSEHRIPELNNRILPIIDELNARLCTLNHQDVATTISDKVGEVRRQTIETIGVFSKNGMPPLREQTFIADGIIEIGEQSVQEFSSNPDYFSATLRLFLENNYDYRDIAREAFENGFLLTEAEKELIKKVRSKEWEMVDVITQILLDEQIAGNYQSLQAIEYLPAGNSEENERRRKEAIKQAFGLTGKIMSSVAHFSNNNNDVTDKDMSTVNPKDPIAMFLYATGTEANSQQINAARIVALAHCSHGFSSAEFTAKLAGSVRTTFPRALIAGHNIRSGIVHGGAIIECMKQIRAYLESGEEPTEYIKKLLSSGEKLYGAGHRVHKITPQTSGISQDPRVQIDIDASRLGFPEKNEEIDKLVAYAHAVRTIKPNLGVNCDFGAAVFFRCLNLSDKAAGGFFIAFRTPGLAAQVVNELSIKSNAQRPPFAPVLPY